MICQCCIHNLFCCTQVGTRFLSPSRRWVPTMWHKQSHTHAVLPAPLLRNTYLMCSAAQILHSLILLKFIPLDILPFYIIKDDNFVWWRMDSNSGNLTIVCYVRFIYGHFSSLNARVKRKTKYIPLNYKYVCGGTHWVCPVSVTQRNDVTSPHLWSYFIFCVLKKWHESISFKLHRHLPSEK